MGRERKVYERIMSDRPEKLNEEEAGYTDPSSVRYKCSGCLHFLERKIDGFGVCELVRLLDDAPIEPKAVCDYWTDDGEVFPLL